MRTNRWSRWRHGARRRAGLQRRCVAQDWPTRPVTMIVPYAPGGNIDQAARVFGRELSEKLGQQFIIESKGGAGGARSARRRSRSRSPTVTRCW